ncbi:hypothetical protein K470DRAFT_12713 [Piedraia hortae CBS 480.64]|uniref:DUF7924 domain-containing protein n=1 Tax=Piedraia hortae CBS 480.64 TaxID=1314780 RepID=A0A6A7BPR7_9PEZI|nr:hypothetical protein K470DRAFT_12713 [Piedraia hortae CBS 480.64]
MWKMDETHPMPGLFYGVSEEYFADNQQLDRLQGYMCNQAYAKCTASHYFPLLVYEFESISGSLPKGDTQSKHAATTAVQAIIELCEIVEVDKLKSLEGKFLCYSVVANDDRIKALGHFFRLGENNKITHYRYTIAFRMLLNKTFDANPDALYKSHILGLIANLLKRAYEEHLTLLKDLVEGLKSSDPAMDDERPTRLILDDRYPEGHTKKRTISGKSRAGKSSQANAHEDNVGDIEAAETARPLAELLKDLENEEMISEMKRRSDVLQAEMWKYRQMRRRKRKYCWQPSKNSFQINDQRKAQASREVRFDDGQIR